MNNSNEFRKYAVHHLGMSGNTVDSYAGKIGGYANQIHDMTQYVIEERPGNFRAIDVFTRLISDRIIFLGMGIDDQIANLITAQLLFLESSDPRKDIIMYINSPGGSVYAGLGIYDTMQYVNPDVATICTGLAASMGAVLLTAGSAKKRSGLAPFPNYDSPTHEWNAGTGFGYGNLPKTDFGGQKGPLPDISEA